MKLLKEFYRSEILNLHGRTISREAVRAIIPNGDQVLMVYSPINKDYKFPGGGIKWIEYEKERDTFVKGRRRAMRRWYRFFQLVVLTWALHRIAMAIIGFPIFSFSDFKLGEFVVDVGVYLIAFVISYWFLRWKAGLGKETDKKETE